MNKLEQILDLHMLFNSLRGAALRCGWHYTLDFSGFEIVVCFHGNYIDSGFNDFIKDLMNLSIFKWSNFTDTILIFNNPIDA